MALVTVMKQPRNGNRKAEIKV